MAERSSLAPSPDYMSEGLPDPDPCSCDEALALRARLTRAEAELQELTEKQYKAVAMLIDAHAATDNARARAHAWHRLARVKARLLHERDSIGPASRGGAVSACLACGQETNRATSSAPVVSLLRILELCWRERHALPADLVERIREQLEGPLGVRAKADMAVLDAADRPVSGRLDYTYEDWCSKVRAAQLARRGLT